MAAIILESKGNGDNVQRPGYLRRRPQRAFRPSAGGGILQRVRLAACADVAIPPVSLSAATSFIGRPQAGHAFGKRDGHRIRRSPSEGT